MYDNWERKATQTNCKIKLLKRVVGYRLRDQKCTEDIRAPGPVTRQKLKTRLYGTRVQNERQNCRPQFNETTSKVMIRPSPG